MSKGLELISNEDGSESIRKKHDDDFDAALLKHGYSVGTHEWQFRLENLGLVHLGVCKLSDVAEYLAQSNDEVQQQYYGMDSDSCTISIGLYDNISGHDWTPGTIVKVVLNCDTGKLIVDGVEIDAPAKEELYPIVILGHEGDKVTLLP